MQIIQATSKLHLLAKTITEPLCRERSLVRSVAKTDPVCNAICNSNLMATENRAKASSLDANLFQIRVTLFPANCVMQD